MELLDVDRVPDAGGRAIVDATPFCPTVCENPHGAADCSGGICLALCAIGYADCDGQPSNGCEANTSNESASCGTCALSCSNEHGSVACSDGICAPLCSPGFADCDDNVRNGCEASLQSVTSCGACNVSCTNEHGETSCTDAGCLPTCAPDYEDCDGDRSNGCEARVESDPLHCGSCTGACDPNTQICVAGSCQPSPCAAGRGECDGDLALACETDLTSSLPNCGFCGNACSVENGSASCEAGTCRVASCGGGFADCDANQSNGCEVRLATSSAHCGACGAPCTNAHGSTRCASSVCTPSCSSGYGDCDTSRQNGCETTLDTVSNCGSCGRVCPANGGTPSCDRGVCTTLCDLTGTYALKLSVPVDWPGTSVLASGNGTFVYWSKVQLGQNGTSLSGSLLMCGQTVPDFKPMLIPETYGIIYPNALFDGTPLPAAATSGLLSNVSPGASFTLARSALTLGVTLADPANGPWPSAGALNQLDSDGDGKPGVTAPYKTGSGYSLPPANPLATVRAARGYLAMRTVFSLNGTLTSCSQSSGAVATDGVQAHTIGCTMNGGGDCNSSQRDHLDTNTPDYRTGAGSFTLVKVADAANCAAVRAALP